MDPEFRTALKFLHSKCSDSAEKIRNSLDELIKQRYGSTKMLANTLNKKILAEECSGTVRKSSKSTESKSSPSVKTIPTVTIDESIQETGGTFEPLVIVPDDDDEEDERIIEEDHLKELEDLMCQICRRMDVNVQNRLVECVECNSLYHQDCHNPKILETEANDSTWHCISCKVQVTKPAINTTPTKSSSSSSTHINKSSSKNYESSSSESSESKKSKSTSNSKVSKSHSKSESSSSSNGNKTVTPNINIISADKRLQIMKKKAAKLQETKRKHK